MPSEPQEKRTNVFFDGQNLYYAAKDAFGYSYPNFDPKCLAQQACQRHGLQLKRTLFYTGVPDARDNPFWNHFWNAKLAVMGTRRVEVFSRSLKYRNKAVRLPDGSSTSVLMGQEKGIDVRLALDVVRQARANDYDVAIIFSQDQDLSEAADEVRRISMEQDRWIKIICAYPMSPTYRNQRGINNTKWFGFDRSFYDSCVDPRDYRPTP